MTLGWVLLSTLTAQGNHPESFLIFRLTDQDAPWELGVLKLLRKSHVCLG